MLATWENLCERKCPLCVKALVCDPPKVILYVEGVWLHEICRQKELQQLAVARKLAVLGMAISEYCF